MIGPLTSATLRVVPSAQHGIASAAVVVARMIGMLVGIAALSAWGLYRFNQILQSLPAAKADNLAAKLAAEAAKYKTAFAMQYGEMFGITAIVCIVGAILALFISGRNEHADEPAAAAEVDGDDSPTQMIDADATAVGSAPAAALGVSSARRPAGSTSARRRSRRRPSALTPRSAQMTAFT